MTQNTNVYYTHSNLNDLNYLDTNYTNTTGYWTTTDTHYGGNLKLIYTSPSYFTILKNKYEDKEEKVDLDDWM